MSQTKIDTKQVKYFSVNFNTKALKEDDEFFWFEGYASTFGNTDLGNEVVVKGAFIDSLREKMPRMVYQHDMRQPIGVYEAAYEDSKGLFVVGKMPKANTQCQNIYSLMKCGAIDSMSIGYRILNYTLKDDVLYLDKVDLIEVSPVTSPMNPAAKITAVKNKDQEGEESEDLKEINKFESIKDVSAFLKARCKLSKPERNTLISKIKGFGGLRNVDPDVGAVNLRNADDVSAKLDEILITKSIDDICRMLPNLSESTNERRSIEEARENR